MAEDQSQLEYYEAIMTRLPGPCDAGTAWWSERRRRFTPEFGELSETEAEGIMRVCDQLLVEYTHRGAAIR